MSTRSRAVLRWTVRGVLILLAVVLAVLLAVALSLRTRYGRDRVRQVAESEISKRLNGDVSIGKLEGSVLHDLTAHDVVLRDADGEVVVRLARLRLEYDPLALLSQHFEADRIAVEGLEVLDRGTLGTLLVGGKEPSKWTVDVDELAVSDSRFSRTRPKTSPLDVRNIDLLASSLHYDSETLGGVLTRASATVRDLGVALEGRVSLDGRSLTAASTTITTGSSRLSIPRGQLDLSAGTFEATLDVHADAAEVRRLIPSWRADVAMAGTASRPEGGPVHVDLSGSVAASPATIELSLDPFEPAVAGRISMKHIAPEQWLRGAPAGNFDASAGVDLAGGSLDSLRGTMKLEVQGPVAGASLDSLSGVVRASGGEATAKLRADSVTYRGAHLRAVSLEASAPLGPHPRIAFRLRAEEADVTDGTAQDVAVEGRFDAARLAGHMTATAGESRYSGEEIGRITARVDVAPGGDPVTARIRAGSGSRYRLAADVVTRREAGATSIDVRQISLTMPELRWRGGLAVSIDRDGTPRLERLDLGSGAGEIIASGTAGEPQERALHFEARHLDLSKLREAIPGHELPPLRGKVTVSVDLELEPLVGNARVEFHDLSWQGRVPPLSGHLALETDHRDLEVELATRSAAGAASLTATVALPPRPLEPSSWWPLDRGRLRALWLGLYDVDLASVSMLLPEGPSAAGRLGGELQLADGGERFDVDARLRHLKVEGLRGLPLRRPVDIVIDGSGDERRVAVDVTGSIRGRRAVTGKVELQAGAAALWNLDKKALRTAALRADLEVPRLALAELVRPGVLGEDMSGHLTASIEARGSIAEPTARVEVRVPDARVGRIGAVALRLEADLDRNGWQGEGSVEHRGGKLVATGRGGPALDAPLRVRVRSDDFDVGALSPILARSDLVVSRATGKLDLSLDVAGSLRRPELSGKARLRGGDARLRTGVRRLKDLWLNLELSRRRLEAVGSARSGDGKVALRASARLDQLVPTSVYARLDANRLPVDTASVRAEVSGQLTVDGSESKGPWTIDASLKNGLVRMPERERATKDLYPTEPPEDIRYVDAAAIAEREKNRRRAESPGPLQQLRLHVSTPGGFRVISGDGASLRGNADLRLSRRGNDVTISGSVEALEGDATLFNRRYEINRALVSFNGEQPINPTLDVSLMHAFDSLDLYIVVSGTLEKPEVELSSNPPAYSRSELLGFVLGGRPSPTTEGGEQSLRSGAASVASSFVAGKLESIIQKPLPFDTVRISSSEQRPGGVSSVTVGRWIANNIFLAYQRRFEAEENENTNEAVVEYHFLPRWLLEAVIGDRGNGSLDVLWIHRFGR